MVAKQLYRDVAFALFLLLISGCTAQLHLYKDNFDKQKVNEYLNDGKCLTIYSNEQPVAVDIAYIHYSHLYYLKDNKLHKIPISKLQKIQMRNYKYGREAGIAFGIVLGAAVSILTVSRDTESCCRDIPYIDPTPFFYIIGGMIGGGIGGAVIGSNLRSKLEIYLD